MLNHTTKNTKPLLLVVVVVAEVVVTDYQNAGLSFWGYAVSQPFSNLQN
jgi:hypothetical protein